LIIEIKHTDIVREPRLIGHVKLLDGNGKIKYKTECDKVYRLTPPAPCPFLDEYNMCRIYETRPDVCREFKADGDMCQELRNTCITASEVQE
jgi:Fe-S-cluster containining protein